MEPAGKFNIKRVAKDAAELHSPKENIWVKVIDDSYDLFYVMMLGVAGTPYEGVIFFFTVEPGASWYMGTTDTVKYPFRAPRVLFYSAYGDTYVHTNLYRPSEGGKTCISTLYGSVNPYDQWVPSMSFTTIFQSVFGFLDTNTMDTYYEGSKCYGKPWDLKCSLTRDVLTKVFLPVLTDKTVDLGINWDGTKPHNFCKIFSDEIKEIYNRRHAQYRKQLTAISNYLKAQGLAQKKDPKDVEIINVYGKPYKMDMAMLNGILDQYPSSSGATTPLVEPLKELKEVKVEKDVKVVGKPKSKPKAKEFMSAKTVVKTTTKPKPPVKPAAVLNDSDLVDELADAEL